MSDDASSEIEAFLAGSLEEAWGRCLVVWRERGRVEDFPKGERRPRYTPDLGKRLGWGFAERFCGRYGPLLERLRSGDPVEALCAFEVLGLMLDEDLVRREHMDVRLPDELFQANTPVPGRVREEMRADELYVSFSGRTAGDYFRWRAESDSR